MSPIEKLADIHGKSTDQRSENTPFGKDTLAKKDENTRDKTKEENKNKLDDVIDEMAEGVEGTSNKEGKENLENYGHDPKGPGIAPIL